MADELNTTDKEAQERVRAWTERMKVEGRLDPFDPIELAVAAERERCAKIAERHANLAAIKSKFDDGYASAARDIADEIRHS